MHPGDPKRLEVLLAGKAEEIGMAVRIAAEQYDRVFELLDPNVVLDKDVEDMQYTFDLLRAYVTAPANERRNQLESFADNYQRSFSDVEAVLRRLGLHL